MLEETKKKKFFILIATTIAVIIIAGSFVMIPAMAKAQRVEAQLSLGEKYFSELDYEQAEVTYLSVQKIDPKNEDAYLALAEVYIAQGEYDEAIETVNEAIGELGDDIDEERVEVLLEELRTSLY